MTSFSDLTVLVTGAAGGIGVSMVKGFAAAGAKVALVDMVDASELAAELGPQHRAFKLDVTDPDAIAKTIATIGAEMGIDILVNNAGLGMVFPADEIRVADWDRMMAINLRAPWLISANALPFLKKSGRGRVINIASKAGVVGIAEHAGYGSTKSGLIGLTQVQALEWAEFGITVNAISPTVVETPMALVGWAGEKGVQARKDIPVGRFAKPSEIADAAIYLASEGAAIVTGTNLIVDGGFTAR